MKLSNKFFFLILFSIFILIPISSFTPDVSANDTTQYISATDILKNFKFESIGDETIVDEGAFNNKLRFDTQSAWLLYKDDVTLLNRYELGDSTQLKYRIVLRNKINIYSNVRINQMSPQMLERSEEFLGVTYKHDCNWDVDFWLDFPSYEWERYITWEHWDFGDMLNYNWQNNYFNGRIKMSFDIDPNPVPSKFGDNTGTEYGYITVSEAGIVNNQFGKMSDDMPEIIVLTPSEEDSGEKSDTTFVQGNTEDDDTFIDQINPNIQLTIDNNGEPIQSFDSSILPDTAGSSMNPENKNGAPLWDPEDERSMTGCNIYYDLNALSPVVYRFGGTLQYIYHDLYTRRYFTENLFDGWATVVEEVHHPTDDYTKHGDVALHGINRYLQVDMMVAFDIWTEVTLGTLTDQYETLKLLFPEEYYDDLIWCTLAGGWTGSTIRQYGSPGWDFFDFFGGIGGIIILILVIAIAGIVIYVFFVFGMPLLRRKRKLKSK